MIPEQLTCPVSATRVQEDMAMLAAQFTDDSSAIEGAGGEWFFVPGIGIFPGSGTACDMFVDTYSDKVTEWTARCTEDLP